MSDSNSKKQEAEEWRLIMIRYGLAVFFSIMIMPVLLTLGDGEILKIHVFTGIVVLVILIRVIELFVVWVLKKFD